MLPYDDIIKIGDRRWSFRLLERLRQPGLEEERDQLVRALCVVSDPRIWRDLLSLLTDRRKSEAIRRDASRIVRNMDYGADMPLEILLDWWENGDAVLRRHALCSVEMGLQEPSIVLRVAADPTHEFHADAINQMDFWFDRPEHQTLKIAALKHPEPRVRENAASVLLWDEPIQAEGPLLRTTADPVEAVAAEACNTLEYYPSQQVLRRLREMRSHPSDKIRQEAEESYDSICASLLGRLTGRDDRVARHIRNWLRPVWDMLAFSAEELTPDEYIPSGPARKPEQQVISCPALRNLLDDPDTPADILKDWLLKAAWEHFTAGERRELRTVFLNHPDQLVRYYATGGLRVWNDVAALMALTCDPDFAVRKSAMYDLGLLPPCEEIARLAWDYLTGKHPLGCHATETLNTYVKHATSAGAIARLVALADDPGQNQNVRTSAVEHLICLRADHALKYLSRWLDEPPPVTWSLHIALLEGFAKRKLPRPSLGELQGVDNLDLQVAIARSGVR